MDQLGSHRMIPGTTEFYITIFLFLIMLVANIHATYLIFKTNEVNRRQKTIQLILVWLIPVFSVVAIIIYKRMEFIKPSDRYIGKDADESVAKSYRS